MYNSDKKILELIDILIFRKKVKNTFWFCKQIGIFPQNIVKIKSGKGHFTPQQIEKICFEFQVNANWIFGIQDEVFISNKD